MLEPQRRFLNGTDNQQLAGPPYHLKKEMTQEWVGHSFAHFDWIVRRRFDCPALKQQMSDPASLVSAPSTYLKPPIPNSGSEVFRREVPQISASPLVIKHYREKDWKQRLKLLFRRSRSLRAFKWAVYLERVQILCLYPVAAGTRKWQPWESFFISLQIEPATTLLQFALSNQDWQLRRKLIRSLAQLLAKLHNAGISYGDAHLANFLVRTTEKHQAELILVDLDGLRHFFWISEWRAARDLRRLRHYSPTTSWEQLRFLAEYARSRKQTTSARRLVNRLERASVVKGKSSC